MEKKKTKIGLADSPLREPKAKKTLGLKIPIMPMPHLELVQPPLEKKPDDFPNDNHTQTDSSNANSTRLSQTTQPSQTTMTSHTTITSQTATVAQTMSNAQEILPTRDFQKVPNSHTRKAIPEGFFKPGKAKHLYDVLYSLTRGAREPKRSLRISKTKIMRQAGIGSRITFDSIMSNFEAVGLVKTTVFTGEHEGNEFEIFTYDEIITLTRLSSQSSSAQKADRVVSLEASQTRDSSNSENKDTSGDLKTLFKTLSFSIDDDTPIRQSFEKLNKAGCAATGKNLTNKDWEAFAEIIELLINETAVARTQTKSISVYLKFAAENLRRRLYAKKPHTNKEIKEEKPN